MNKNREKYIEKGKQYYGKQRKHTKNSFCFM